MESQRFLLRDDRWILEDFQCATVVLIVGLTDGVIIKYLNSPVYLSDMSNMLLFINLGQNVGMDGRVRQGRHSMRPSNR